MSFKTTITDGIAELVVDHPPVNAMDSKGWNAFALEVERLGRDPEVRVVIIAADGRGFNGGVDIKELAADPSIIVTLNHGCWQSFSNVYDCQVPVISAVHGFCLGGGIGIAGSSDFVIASEDATFGLPRSTAGRSGRPPTPCASSATASHAACSTPRSR